MGRLFTNSKYFSYSFFLWHNNYKKLQIFIITFVSFSITFISSLASPSSEGKINGFTASLSSTKIDSWEFSFCLPATQCCPFFKQCIKSHPLYHHLQGSNHNTSMILCFHWTVETRYQVPIQFFSWNRTSHFHLQ